MPAAIRLGPVLKAGLICSAIVFVSVGYVWQKKQINVLADQIRQREAVLARLREQNDKMKNQLADFVSSRVLDARVKELRLGLVVPQPTQIWCLPEPTTEPSTPSRDRRPQTEQIRGGIAMLK